MENLSATFFIVKRRASRSTTVKLALTKLLDIPEIQTQVAKVIILLMEKIEYLKSWKVLSGAVNSYVFLTIRKYATKTAPLAPHQISFSIKKDFSHTDQGYSAGLIGVQIYVKGPPSAVIRQDLACRDVYFEDLSGIYSWDIAHASKKENAG